TGFGYQRRSVGREENGERSRAGAGVDHDWSQGTVDLNVEGVDVVGGLFGYEQKFAVGAEGQRSGAGVAGGEIREGIRNWLECSISVQPEAHDVAGAAGIDHIYEVS